MGPGVCIGSSGFCDPDWKEVVLKPLTLVGIHYTSFVLYLRKYVLYGSKPTQRCGRSGLVVPDTMDCFLPSNDHSMAVIRPTCSWQNPSL